MRYLVLKNDYQEGHCVLGALQNVPRDEDILAGLPRSDGFPDDAYYEMSHELPKDIQVPDSACAMIHFVVSPRLAQALADDPGLGASRIEFLPVKIKNHKGRFVRGIFFVLNPLDIVDAIDIAASGARFNLIEPTEIATVDRLVLRDLADPPAVFRPLHFRRLVLVREDVAGRLLAAGLTGLQFAPPERFRG